MRVGVKLNGTLTAIHVTNIANQGYAVAHNTFSLRNAGYQLLALYNKCSNARYEGYCIYTNLPSGGGTRGFGRPGTLFAFESVIDDVACDLGVDPIELRLKNTVCTGENLGAGYYTSSVALDRCLREGSKAIGWHRRNSVSVGTNALVKTGLGVAVAIHSGGLGYVDTESELELLPNGNILLRTGIPDQGTEQQTTQAQYIAEELGIPFEKIKSLWADTGVCPHDFGIYSSSSTAAKGMATVMAARDLKKKMIERAAAVLGERTEGLYVHDGFVLSTSNPNKRVAFGMIAELAASQGERLVGKGRPGVPRNIGVFSFAANFAEVEVNIETGNIKILDFVTAMDVGRAINPLLLEGQMKGAIMQGIGYALYEEVVFDEVDKGVALNDDYLNYRLPSILDAPRIKTIIVDNLEPLHPYGAKGAGELAMNATAPAIANAIYNAIGVRITEIPITPDKVLRALEKTPLEKRGVKF